MTDLPSQSAKAPRKKSGCFVSLSRTAGILLIGMIALWFALRIASRRELLPGDAREILENADTFEIVSVDPSRLHKGPDMFHGFTVRGRTILKDRPTQQKLLSHLYGSLGHGIPGMMCFDPRHAIHATRQGRSVDLLICFECEQVKGFLDGKETLELVGSGAHATFEEIYQAAGLPPEQHW